jgi:hypothetical protein
LPDADKQVFHIEQPDKHDQIRLGAVAAERNRRRCQGGLELVDCIGKEPA